MRHQSSGHHSMLSAALAEAFDTLSSLGSNENGKSSPDSVQNAQHTARRAELRSPPATSILSTEANLMKSATEAV